MAFIIFVSKNNVIIFWFNILSKDTSTLSLLHYGSPAYQHLTVLFFVEISLSGLYFQNICKKLQNMIVIIILIHNIFYILGICVRCKSSLYFKMVGRWSRIIPLHGSGELSHSSASPVCSIDCKYSFVEMNNKTQIVL